MPNPLKKDIANAERFAIRVARRDYTLYLAWERGIAHAAAWSALHTEGVVTISLPAMFTPRRGATVREWRDAQSWFIERVRGIVAAQAMRLGRGFYGPCVFAV